MYVIISGSNRTEFCNVERHDDLSRRFFMTRGQLYFIPVDGMVRMTITEYGKRRPSQAVIAYEENSIFPYDMKGKKYSMDRLLNAIDRFKMMTNYKGFGGKQPWFTNRGNTWVKMLMNPTTWTIILVVIVLIGGFLS